MDIKIPGGPPQGAPTDAITDAAQAAEESTESAATQSTEAAETDAIAQIADQVAAGKLAPDEAVERILGEVLNSESIQAAPPEVRAELADALRTLIETDPHLSALTSVLGLDLNNG